MKLAKTKLIKGVKDTLGELGYLELKNTLTGASGLFIKPLDNGFYLTFGLEISNYYDSKFSVADYQFVPQRPIDDIPIEWFKAAENVLLK